MASTNQNTQNPSSLIAPTNIPTITNNKQLSKQQLMIQPTGSRFSNTIQAPIPSFDIGTSSLPHHYPQPVIQQPQQPLDHTILIIAYGIIIVSLVILVVALVFRFFDRATQRHRHQENNHVEDVATLQNHQNIYKSRTSLSTDKVPLGDTIDGSSTTTSSSTYSSNRNGCDDMTYDRRIHGHHMNNHNSHRSVTGTRKASTTASTRTGPLNPPPPYTISHSHPNSTYNNSTYNNSIHYHPLHPSANHTNSSIYNNSSTISSPYGTQTSTTATTASNPYVNTVNSTYQSPYYVIYHIPLPNPCPTSKNGRSGS